MGRRPVGHLCSATFMIPIRRRSGEFCVYRVVASHLRRQEIHIICLKFSQPALSPCIFNSYLSPGNESHKFSQCQQHYVFHAARKRKKGHSVTKKSVRVDCYCSWPRVTYRYSVGRQLVKKTKFYFSEFPCFSCAALQLHNKPKRSDFALETWYQV